jgi:hypothetical protein
MNQASGEEGKAKNLKLKIGNLNQAGGEWGGNLKAVGWEPSRRGKGCVEGISNFRNQGVPNFLESKFLEIFLIHRGKSIHSMVLECVGEARIDNVPVS